MEAQHNTFDKIVIINFLFFFAFEADLNNNLGTFLLIEIYYVPYFLKKGPPLNNTRISNNACNRHTYMYVKFSNF